MKKSIEKFYIFIQVVVQKFINEKITKLYKWECTTAFAPPGSRSGKRILIFDPGGGGSPIKIFSVLEHK